MGINSDSLPRGWRVLERFVSITTLYHTIETDSLTRQQGGVDPGPTVKGRLAVSHPLVRHSAAIHAAEFFQLKQIVCIRISKSPFVPWQQSREVRGHPKKGGQIT
jgi:hypothetical protein